MTYGIRSRTHSPIGNVNTLLRITVQKEGGGLLEAGGEEVLQVVR